MYSKGDTVNVKDSDGGTTKAKVTQVFSENSIEVKWLEPRWNLNSGILVARKGSKSTVSTSQIA